MNDRVSISGQKENLNLRVSGIFDLESVKLTKKEFMYPFRQHALLVGKRFGGSFFQLGLKDPFDAEKIALQIQETTDTEA